MNLYSLECHRNATHSWIPSALYKQGLIITVAVCQSLVKLLVLYVANSVVLLSGSRRDGAEKCAPLDYTASSGNFLTTFRETYRCHHQGSGIISYWRFGKPIVAIIRVKELFLTFVSGQLIAVFLRNQELFLIDVSGQPIGTILRIQELFLTDVSGNLSVP